VSQIVLLEQKSSVWKHNEGRTINPLSNVTSRSTDGVLTNRLGAKHQLAFFSVSRTAFPPRRAHVNNPSGSLLGEDCSSHRLSRSRLPGHNTSLWTFDTCLTARPRCLCETRRAVRHYGSPHTILAESSFLKGFPGSRAGSFITPVTWVKGFCCCYSDFDLWDITIETGFIRLLLEAL